MASIRHSVAVLACAGVTLLTGCASHHYVDCTTGQYDGWIPGYGVPVAPRLDCGFGDSVNVAVARQVLDPDAVRRNGARTASGLDGVAAREAMVRYQKSFRAPEPAPNVFNIGLPGQQGGQ